jgi:subtilisin family serine protease
MSRLRHFIFLTLAFLSVGFVAAPSAAHAITFSDTSPVVPNDFNLQITPSPLVITVTPGTKSQTELKIRNGSTGTEQLKIEARSFTLENDSTKVNLQDTTPRDIGTWMSFSQPRFTALPGQWISEQITFTVPKTAGFSYSFALVISRQSDPKPTNAGRLIKGSVAVFTLVNVDRPGATSELQVSSFTASKHVYDYLPATFSVKFKNTGNTIAQPYGNIFVSRSGKGRNPLGTLVVNESKGYILPGTERAITASWSDAFPVYKSVDSNGSSAQKLIWNWGDLSKLRIGRYTAHLVAVYNQAGRDVPIEGSVSFWVIPWKILLLLLIILVLVLFAIFILIRGIIRMIRRRVLKTDKKHRSAASSSQTSPPDDAV